MRPILVAPLVAALASVLISAQLAAQIRAPTITPPMGGHLGPVGGQLRTNLDLNTSLTPTGLSHVELRPSTLNSGLSASPAPGIAAPAGEHSTADGRRHSETPMTYTPTLPAENSTWQSGPSGVPDASMDVSVVNASRAVAVHAGGEPPRDKDDDDDDSDEGKTNWWLWLLIAVIGVGLAAWLRR